MPQFPVTRAGQTTTVTANDKLQSCIVGDEDIEETITDLVSGVRTPHSVGKSCSGDPGGAILYVHIVRSYNQKLLAYTDLSKNPRSVTITAVGMAQGGKHSFNIKGKF